MPFKQNGYIQPSPHTSMQLALHGHGSDLLRGPATLLPFGQAGFVGNTKKFKKKLEDRAIPANYHGCLSQEAYQVYRRDKKGITSVRQDELVLQRKEKQKEQTQNDEPLPGATKSQTRVPKAPAGASTENREPKCISASDSIATFKENSRAVVSTQNHVQLTGKP